MAYNNLQRWVREYRKAAEADDYKLFKSELNRLALPEVPELMLEGTINVIIACQAYAALDNQSFGAFLKMQRYDPAEAVDAQYVFTFDLCGKAYGRVLFSDKVGILDLADLYGHPWEDYKVCGYHAIYISRVDGRYLGKRELARLEKEVNDDLYFDYGEDELDCWFDDLSIDGTLLVTLQDHEEF